MTSHAKSPVRLGLLALALALVACSGKTDFSISRSFNVISSGAPAGYSIVEPISLPADAPEAWKHRSKATSVDLVAIDATVTANLSGNATTASGSIFLRPDGGAGANDVLIGIWTNEAIPLATPHSIGLVLSPAAEAVIENALDGSGNFAIVASGSTADPVQFRADLTLHLKLNYKVP
jgi:hypothetical protein